MLALLAIITAFVIRLINRNPWSAFIIGFCCFLIINFAFIKFSYAGELNLNSYAITRFLTDSLGRFVFGFAIATGFYLLFVKEKRKTNNQAITPFQKSDILHKQPTKEKVNYKLTFQASLKENLNKESNWRARQEINVLLLWTNFLEDSEFEFIDERLSTKDYMKLLLFPQSLRPNTKSHIKFAEEIIKNYTDTQLGKGKNEYINCTYKPEYLLKYPKLFIEKSIGFIASHPNTPKHVSSNLYGLQIGLMFFVNVEKNQLPTDPIENKKVGLNYIDTSST